jgi:hypothetical protein
MGNERTGVIKDLAIIPKLHGFGVEKEIVKFAVGELEKRKKKSEYDACSTIALV